ncbi:hypothetical protein Q0V21_25085 [Paenibacillus sp. 11B]|uniref:hypothetical protein n=1 Tax=unclassified Paenibacillus TaxID=185978 RepID=UPI00265422B8|nr:hypothetical protein [Paenibacillus sp. 11B]MDN8592025.1 hypothetical protein [Paenibacillus sp. 11B]
MSDVKEERAAKAAKVVPAEPRFSKEQFLQSTKYNNAEKDVFMALLQDGQTYTHQEVQRQMNVFKSREVR